MCAGGLCSATATEAHSASECVWRPYGSNSISRHLSGKGYFAATETQAQQWHVNFVFFFIFKSFVNFPLLTIHFVAHLWKFIKNTPESEIQETLI